jgi:hypothetical protein
MSDENHTNDGPERTDDATLAQIVRLAFGDDRGRFAQFLERVRSVTPSTAAVILRGSAVTGTRWEDGTPFDADGQGTSDLDLTFVDGDMTKYWEGFYIPGMHTLPLSEQHPNACPPFVSLREELCEIAGRPVNLQATRSFVQFARDVMMDQPYFTLIQKSADTIDSGEPQ